MSPEPTKYQLGELPANGFLRQSQIIPNPKQPNRPSIVPFSRATLWRKVKSGHFPKPVKLSERVTAWRVEDIRAWINSRTSDMAKGRAD